MSAQKAANRFKIVTEALDRCVANLGRYRLENGEFFNTSAMAQIKIMRDAIESASAEVSAGPVLTRARASKSLEVGMSVDVKGMPGIWTIASINEMGGISLTNEKGERAFATKQACDAHKEKSAKGDDDDDDDDKPAPAPAPAARGPGRPAARGRIAPPRVA